MNWKTGEVLLKDRKTGGIYIYILKRRWREEEEEELRKKQIRKERGEQRG